jgi:DNA anti-recombination protein RmuC
MASSAEPNGRIAPEGESPEIANVDKIREILFGGQMRDYDKRFVRVEERLAKDINSLRDDLKKRLDALEAFMHQEVEMCNQRLKAEKADRAAALKEIEKSLREAERNSEKRFTEMEEGLAQGTADLRARILEQSNTLTSDIEAKHRALTTLLDGEVQTLQEDKTDRAALADLFTEVAMRLKKDFALQLHKAA